MNRLFFGWALFFALIAFACSEEERIADTSSKTELASAGAPAGSMARTIQIDDDEMYRHIATQSLYRHLLLVDAAYIEEGEFRFRNPVQYLCGDGGGGYFFAVGNAFFHVAYTPSWRHIGMGYFDDPVQVTSNQVICKQNPSLTPA